MPPPARPLPAATVSDGLASIELVTPPLAIAIVPLVEMGPPVRPAPVFTVVTVPPEVLSVAGFQVPDVASNFSTC